MNNYNQMMDCPIEGTRELTDLPPLSEITEKATCMAVEALQMAYRINQHLFGLGEPMNEKPNEPKCYRDVLELQTETLNKLCCELGKIMKDIGI